jgi:hypothetical protein
MEAEPKAKGAIGNMKGNQYTGKELEQIPVDFTHSLHA